MNDTYMEQEELNRYVSQFWAGFAFYDFYRFATLRKFNYFTAPSGKLFQYFNSGVPVIGNQLSGFKMVEDHKAGQLIEHLGSLEIKKALDVINASYLEFSTNSKKLSREFDLKYYMDKAVREITGTN